MPYAEDTRVPVARTRAEIEAVLTKYGADQFVSGWTEEEAAIGFRIAGRQITIKLPIDPKMSEQKKRSRWRALFLIIKSKLVAIDSGITTLEREFLADVRMYDGRTVYEWAKPSIDKMYLEGKMPPLLPSGPKDI